MGQVVKRMGTGMAEEQDPKKVRTRLEFEIAQHYSSLGESANAALTREFAEVGRLTANKFRHLLEGPNSASQAAARIYKDVIGESLGTKYNDLLKDHHNITPAFESVLKLYGPMTSEIAKAARESISPLHVSNFSSSIFENIDLSATAVSDGSVIDYLKSDQLIEVEATVPAILEIESETLDKDEPSMNDIAFNASVSLSRIEINTSEYLSTAKKSATSTNWQFWALAVIGVLTLGATVLIPFIKP